MTACCVVCCLGFGLRLLDVRFGGWFWGLLIQVVFAGSDTGLGWI